VEQQNQGFENNPRLNKVFSIGNDNVDGCRRGKTSCLGAVYWNWGPLYARVVNEVRKGTWKAQVINDAVTQDEATSLVFFGVSKEPGLIDTDTALAAGKALSAMVSGQDNAFRGPFKLSVPDQLPTGESSVTIASGKVISDEELNQMCWFVDGVVTSDGITDTAARVPYGDVALFKDQKPDCRLNR
jgi:hypothetical protein